jgi:hypothetical protein
MQSLWTFEISFLVNGLVAQPVCIDSFGIFPHSLANWKVRRKSGVIDCSSPVKILAMFLELSQFADPKFREPGRGKGEFLYFETNNKFLLDLPHKVEVLWLK